MTPDPSADGRPEEASSEARNAAGRPAWTTIRERLDARGFRPSRRLGQNFLLDENMLRAIVRAAELDPGDRVLEVGPGLGFLTLHLAPEVRELVCVEIDARLLEFARELCAGETNVRWVCTDVLASKHALDPSVAAFFADGAPWKLVANLPYSVSAPLLAVLSELENAPVSMTVLVQREVAERIVAVPATNDWGPLAIRLQLDYEARILRSVPAQLFWPRPEIESSIVRLVRRPSGLEPAVRHTLDRLVASLFQRRRQALSRVLGEAIGRDPAAEVFAALAVDPRSRAEDLPASVLLRLAAELDRRGLALPRLAGEGRTEGGRSSAREPRPPPG